MNNLQSLRRAAGLTQEQLSAASGVKFSALQKLEYGVNSLAGARADTVQRLARALGVAMEDLLADGHDNQE